MAKPKPKPHCIHLINQGLGGSDVYQCCFCGESRKQVYDMVTVHGHGPHGPKQAVFRWEPEWLQDCKGPVSK